MPTLSAAIAAISRHIGFPESRARQVARRLRDAEVIPMGAPGVAPEVEPIDVLSLILAVGADTTLREAADAVSTYSELTPGGADVTAAPARIPRNARDALLVFADLAIEGDNLSSMSIEIVATWPEIVIRWTDGTSQHFREIGALATHWQDGRQRKSTMIPGSAFAGLFKELFS